MSGEVAGTNTVGECNYPNYSGGHTSFGINREVLKDQARIGNNTGQIRCTFAVIVEGKLFLMLYSLLFLSLRRELSWQP